MRKLVCALTVLLIAGATAAYADQLAKGNQELIFAFSYSDSSPDVGDNTKDTDLIASWGYLFTDRQEAGLELSYSKIETGTTDSDSTAISPFYEFNFKAGDSANPYIGVQYNFFSGDQGDIYDDGWGLRGGIKFYPWANAGFNFGVRWNQLNGADNNPDADELSFLAGVLIKW